VIALADAEDARSAGKLAPHLVLNVTEDMQIMKEEIFGPLLPVKTYRGLDEVLEYVNSHERPLAFYYFDDDRGRTDMMLKKTISGGVSVNTVMLHVLQENLPFGGVGNSGLGHYHAEEGFHTFSKMRPIFYQSKINGSALLKPPYGKITSLLLKLTLR
jgi:coniferyl-aldehyde dehydrogenase